MAASGRDLQMRELMDTMKELKLTIEALRKELTTKDKLIENQQEQIAYLQKKLFGTSSEKRSLVVEGQLGLFDEVEVEAAKDEPEPDAEEEVVTFTKSRKPKTLKEELLKGVPVKEKVIPLPEAEPVGGFSMHKITPKRGIFFFFRDLLSIRNKKQIEIIVFLL